MVFYKYTLAPHDAAHAHILLGLVLDYYSQSEIVMV